MWVLALDQIPVEILLGIFLYLDIPDLLRLRRVSRYLNEVSLRRDVWTDAYRNAVFVHPPGPFLSQSIHDLEDTLIPSFRVHENLRQGGGSAHQEMPMCRKLTGIWYKGEELGARLVFGRFLIIALSEAIRCYDLNLTGNRNSDASIIYRPTDGTFLTSFHCISAIDIEGHPFACMVLREAVQVGNRNLTKISIYLLNVTNQSEVTLDLLYQFEHSQFNNLTVQLGPRVIIVSGSVGGRLDDDWHIIALDVHARTQFLLEHPSFPFEGWEVEETSGAVAPLWSISTSTHLLIARSLFTLTAGWCTFFQAFTLAPPLNARQRLISPSVNLEHSHRGTISGINATNLTLLRDAILDQFTQDILITIRVHEFNPASPDFILSKYGTLRLGKSHDKIGPITFELLGSFPQLPRFPCFHPSFNGTGRVIYTQGSYAMMILAVLEYDVRRSGNRDDEPEGKVIEFCSLTQFRNPCSVLDYDPYSGRICIQYEIFSQRFRVIEVLDLVA